MKELSVDLLAAFFFTLAAFLSMKQDGPIMNISSAPAVGTTPPVPSLAVGVIAFKLLKISI